MRSEAGRMMSCPENEPIACSLDAAGGEERIREWAGVLGGALRVKVATARGVRLDFAPVPDATRALFVLVVAERECCAWASWTLTSTGEATVVDVTAGGGGRDVLHAMFDVRP